MPPAYYMSTRHIIIIFIFISLYFENFCDSCEVNLSALDLAPHQYNGSWFVVARKPPKSHSFVPQNITSSLIKLDVDGDIIHMTEYHTINTTCKPPLIGTWTKQNKGYDMTVTEEDGKIFNMSLFPIFHGYSGEQNEEMNMVLYGCSKRDKDKKCERGEELVMVMSNSRHPQTLQLFKSAKLIEDSACIDILEFRILETYSACGDEVVDEDQKLVHARIDENNEFVDVECKVGNFRPPPNNISKFFDEPRILTVVAYIDPILSLEQIAHISCMYISKQHATCEWIRQNRCLRTELYQNLETKGYVAISSNYTTIAGNTSEIDWSGSVIWENGDEYISIQCMKVDEDGACDSNRVYVWSDEDHMDQPTINEIYRQLQAYCIDPTDLVFLNTFHECTEQIEAIQSETTEACDAFSKFPLTTQILEGVWYFAADLNAEPKIFLQSAVVNMSANPNETDVLLFQYFAQKEVDSECVGPGEGYVTIAANNELHVTVQYSYTFAPSYKNIMKFKYQVLYIDNQRAVLYWCYKRDVNGNCTQHDVNFMIRSRHFSRNDLTMISPYLDCVNIDKESLRWFDLHSLCGTEMAATTRLRRDLITLSHVDVLYILTNVQEPQCLISQLKGVKADLTAMEKAGTWYLVSRYDEMAMDTYAMVGRIFAVSSTTAVLKLRQSAALPGEPLDCFTRVFTMNEFNNGTDYWYELHYESTTKNSTTMIFRFLFFNRHVGVVYSCLANKADGQCDEKAIYVISRHESIDHAELIVLETIAKTVCVSPNVLYHTAVHDDCVFDTTQLKQTPCSNVQEVDADAEWLKSNSTEMMSNYGTIVYHAVASSRKLADPVAFRFDGITFQKISDDPSGCLSSPTTIDFSSRNHLLGRLGTGEIVLLHPAGLRDEVRLKEAQQVGNMPCLYQLSTQEVTCSLLQRKSCLIPEKLENIDELEGQWLLYASDPSYVLNQRCSIQNTAENDFDLNCHSESWIGECERETTYRLKLIENGSFELEAMGDDAPLRHPSELFHKGKLSVTAERLLMIADDDFFGRRYSVWLKKNTDFTRDVEAEVAKYCVWPVGPQIRSMEQGGCLEKTI
ncbi:unnamed protein product [Auanema sp. JU1783]|nr:unnamed protein product [Auanema sp. JU1783]